METIWFIVVCFLLISYVVLDGFDLGAGTLHLLVAREDRERRAVLMAVGPVWDGNEVALVASGGALILAFPSLYASALSGFYLPMFIVFWLLVLRGVSIEVRQTMNDPLWHSFWDFTFFLGSALLPFAFGTALANVMRGLPLHENGFFFMPLWTDFDPLSSHPGILDWYTTIIGFLAFFALATHGANFLAVRTRGEVRARARIFSISGWVATLVLTVLGTVSTFYLFPRRLDNFFGMPWGLAFPLAALGGLAGMGYFALRGRDWPAFASSALYVAGMLASTAFSLFPDVLPATNPANSLTVHNASTTTHGLVVGMISWLVGMVLAAAWFFITYGLFFRERIEEEG
ncbi:MAG: cytochrome d ubiquinol oxidase subunit II [Rubrobacteraceae bacterium]|uniref:cytochrome d ubiquinol oxidase subunit II n=1 Tax=Rubrobacter naiadicus TaxID=1392641 RepID=UPI00235F4C1C|nr:cytochrome d ubiquinol oxidase subunit II [Rubrobacter naiadicus]MBX6765073.1 cytochrome d ubiquinol oxidase subunit II [Rubrobacteraceae bacterium]MCL6437492.1 cytochrome d ubiquinol oxidase subunit II [Rubrobacteraceae bacterium]